ncbi:MAG: UDP-glucose 4-epimerase, partial [Myxococcota bacterium]
MTHLQPTSQVETEHGRSRVLVTGGAGFIGSHLVDRLIADGHHVVVVDDLSTGHRSNLQAHVDGPTLTFIEADVGALQRDSDLLGRIGVVTHVVHLAAQTSVVRSVEDPSADFATNASGLFQVIELARQHQSAVVLASSAAVYGNVDVLPVAEDAPAKPLSPYGIHKHLGEHYLRAWSALYGLSTTALRFFNVYGPRQDPKSPYSGVISIFIDRA